MCELLALSANTPTDIRFSFHGLRLRGGSTSDHADGWGLASFDPDGQGLHLYREDAPAAFSPVAAAVAALDLKAHCTIAHIRRGGAGELPPLPPALAGPGVGVRPQRRPAVVAALGG
jgi:glutamine amidotransferase